MAEKLAADWSHTWPGKATFFQCVADVCQPYILDVRDFVCLVRRLRLIKYYSELLQRGSLKMSWEEWLMINEGRQDVLADPRFG